MLHQSWSLVTSHPAQSDTPDIGPNTNHGYSYLYVHLFDCFKKVKHFICKCLILTENKETS